MKPMFIFPETKLSAEQIQAISHHLNQRFASLQDQISQYIISALEQKTSTLHENETKQSTLSLAQLEEIGLELADFLKKNKGQFNSAESSLAIDKFIMTAEALTAPKTTETASKSQLVKEETSGVDHIIQRKIMQLIDTSFDEKVESYIRQKVQTIIKRMIIEEIHKL